MAQPTYEVKIKDEEAEAPTPDPIEVPEPEPTPEPESEPESDPTQTVISKIGDALGLTKKEEEFELPKTQEELDEIISKNVSTALSEREQGYQQSVEESQKEQSKRVDGIIAGWHGEYNKLASAGRVPKIVNADDQNDPGVKARRQLILGVGDIIAEDRKAGISRTPSLSEVIVSNPNTLRGVPGADLPISGNTVGRETPANYSNKEIKGKSMQQILSEG